VVFFVLTKRPWLQLDPLTVGGTDDTSTEHGEGQEAMDEDEITDELMLTSESLPQRQQMLFDTTS
jgi:hypothetical protein